jgi:hypothetical protein
MAATRILGDGPEMAPDRTIQLVPYLAAMGGSAAWSELPGTGKGGLPRVFKPREDLAHGRVAIAAGLAVVWQAGP